MRYDRRKHAARDTQDYVFQQLIPYIGNKRKLLPLIGEAIDASALGRGASFVDLFSGSGVVALTATVRLPGASVARFIQFRPFTGSS